VRIMIPSPAQHGQLDRHSETASSRTRGTSLSPRRSVTWLPDLVSNSGVTAAESQQRSHSSEIGSTHHAASEGGEVPGYGGRAAAITSREAKGPESASLSPSSIASSSAAIVNSPKLAGRLVCDPSQTGSAHDAGAVARGQDMKAELLPEPGLVQVSMQRRGDTAANVTASQSTAASQQATTLAQPRWESQKLTSSLESQEHSPPGVHSELSEISHRANLPRAISQRAIVPFRVQAANTRSTQPNRLINPAGSARRYFEMLNQYGTAERLTLQFVDSMQCKLAVLQRGTVLTITAVAACVAVIGVTFLTSLVGFEEYAQTGLPTASQPATWTMWVSLIMILVLTGLAAAGMAVILVTAAAQGAGAQAESRGPNRIAVRQTRHGVSSVSPSLSVQASEPRSSAWGGGVVV
jgi:hypothetical protein